MPMKGSALALVLLLIGSIVPLAVADEGNTTTTEVPEFTLDENATNREEVIAQRLISHLEKLSEFTTKRIEPIRDKLPENSTILFHYEKGEELKDKAIEEFNNGDYYNSILDALTAMRHYKLVLIQLKEGRERINEYRERIFGMINRMVEYFRFVERTIKIAENQGIDVSNITHLYNETREAYKVVLDDLKAKDFEKAKQDLEIAQEKKVALDEELRKIREQLAYMNADKIVKDFLIRTENGIKFAERSIQEAKLKGIDTSEAEAKLEEMKAIYEEVKSLADQERWEEALEVIKENRIKIDMFFKGLQRIRERITEQKIKMDAKVFIRETTERIRKDIRALEVLRQRGVNTRRAEIELRTAIQEMQIGIRMLKEGKVAMAKSHFAITLKLLYNVEKFILLHS
jgi:hypothetical protein